MASLGQPSNSGEGRDSAFDASRRSAVLPRTDATRSGAADLSRAAGPVAALPAPPETTELGIDIIRVSRIKASLERFGERFVGRVLTPTEAAYVRNRPETMAGRWAAKEAVSKVLGLGVRGIGWRDIEIERLPTGQPAVKLHGRAQKRAEQLGMGRVAVSISHESEFAVAIAFGIRTAGGRFLYPPDIGDRLSEHEARIMKRFERLRGMAKDVAVMEGKLAAAPAPTPAPEPAPTSASMGEEGTE
ncbi:MAG TPA: holo-ACP synthase [Terriglobales bacterium]|nr:holo-ACP synthase [Terriglobales bacterium]